MNVRSGFSAAVRSSGSCNNIESSCVLRWHVLSAASRHALTAYEHRIHEHGGQDSHERHVVREADGAAGTALVHEPSDGRGIEVPRFGQPAWAQQVVHVLRGPAAHKKAPAIRCAVWLLRTRS